MRALVTCGPSFEPIDEVRRITNFSTGELGTLLGEALVAAGVETTCLRGVAATFPRLPAGVEVIPFTTNGSLAALLQDLARGGGWQAVFHAAALADYRVAAIHDRAGQPLQGAKLQTGFGGLTLHLETTAKLLPEFRVWFPQARIIGWKYELEGDRPQALQRAHHQLQQCQTDACVVNGRAFGPGFGLCLPDAPLELLPNKQLLCAHLVQKFCA